MTWPRKGTRYHSEPFPLAPGFGYNPHSPEIKKGFAPDPTRMLSG